MTGTLTPGLRQGAGPEHNARPQPLVPVRAFVGGGPVIDIHRVVLEREDDFDGWRDAARDLVDANVPPSAIIWETGESEADLFASDEARRAGRGFAVPRAFIALAKDAICHSDPERFALLYQLLLAIRSDRRAIEDKADPLLHRLERLAKAVRRDIHKMHAFVRFRELESGEGSRFVAFFEPEHHIVRRAASFFVNRFANMRWSILTPLLSIHWDGDRLTQSPGASRADCPDGDPLESVWRTYYASTFNPARLKTKAMLKEMPRKYWRNMPETSLVNPLIASAREREIAMIARSLGDTAIAERGFENALEAERQVEPKSNVRAAWEEVLKGARGCTRCELYKCGTQTVFGEGPLDSRILFVGEQPGDQEDLAGRPFVGPAGQLFDEALEQAGIDRTQTYVTNAVKHFKFVARGKRRIHSKPDAGEIQACKWWLEQEREIIRPPITVALGATAARSLVGKVVTIGKVRGEPLELADGSECWITVHPSFLLRIPEPDRKRQERERFVDDLKRIRERAAELAD